MNPTGNAENATEQSAVGEGVWNLRLYLAGGMARSLAALASVQRLCDVHLPGKYRLEVIDLLAQPRRAAEDRVVVLPTLVRKQPVPSRTITGDLSDTERVLTNLQLRREPGRQPPLQGIGAS
jgi:circadian clock protein KaiB